MKNSFLTLTYTKMYWDICNFVGVEMLQIISCMLLNTNYNNYLITVLFKLTVSTVQTTRHSNCCVYLHKMHTQFPNSATYTVLTCHNINYINMIVVLFEK